jgi:hypothetical protein
MIFLFLMQFAQVMDSQDGLEVHFEKTGFPAGRMPRRICVLIDPRDGFCKPLTSDSEFRACDTGALDKCKPKAKHESSAIGLGVHFEKTGFSAGRMRLVVIWYDGHAVSLW